MPRLLVVVITAALGMLYLPAQASLDPALMRRQDDLVIKRADVQRQIQSAERRLHHLETDRKDKLEELGELHHARADIATKHAFSKDVDSEIAAQSNNLRRIEEKRSDCLEELDGLYQGLSAINREMAECHKQQN